MDADNSAGLHERVDHDCAGASDGNRVLFISVLGENHGRMTLHLRPMQFFDENRIPDQVTYTNVGRTLEDDGLPGLLAGVGALGGWRSG